MNLLYYSKNNDFNLVKASERPLNSKLLQDLLIEYKFFIKDNKIDEYKNVNIILDDAAFHDFPKQWQSLIHHLAI
jgi:hypothetical protein